MKIDLEESGKVNMAENNFTFGFFTTDHNLKPVKIPKRIGTLKAYQIEYDSFSFLKETELDVRLTTENEMDNFGVSERLAGLMKYVNFSHIDFTDANLQGS